LAEIDVVETKIKLFHFGGNENLTFLAETTSARPATDFPNFPQFYTI